MTLTPKEKAKELVDKYFAYLVNNVADNFYIYESHAKDCAKIAVNEIIEHGNLLSNSLLDGYIDSEFNFYWNEVLKEIDNYDSSK